MCLCSEREGKREGAKEGARAFACESSDNQVRAVGLGAMDSHSTESKQKPKP